MITGGLCTECLICIGSTHNIPPADRLQVTIHKMNMRQRVLAIVEVSVRPSVTLLICIKTVQARITKSLLWAASRTLFL